MIEFIYAYIRKAQLAHSEGSPRIEAIVGVCIVLVPVCFAVISLALPVLGISPGAHGNVRQNPMYWAAIAISAALAFALFDRRISEIDLKYEDLQVPATLAKKVPFIAYLLSVGVALAFLAFRWPVACLTTFSILEIATGWWFGKKFR